MCGQLTLGINFFFQPQDWLGLGLGYTSVVTALVRKQINGDGLTCNNVPEKTMMSMKEMKTRPFVISSSDE